MVDGQVRELILLLHWTSSFHAFSTIPGPYCSPSLSLNYLDAYSLLEWEVSKVILREASIRAKAPRTIDIRKEVIMDLEPTMLCSPAWKRKDKGGIESQLLFFLHERASSFDSSLLPSTLVDKDKTAKQSDFPCCGSNQTTRNFTQQLLVVICCTELYLWRQNENLRRERHFGIDRRALHPVFKTVTVLTECLRCESEHR